MLFLAVFAAPDSGWQYCANKRSNTPKKGSKGENHKPANADVNKADF